MHEEKQKNRHWGSRLCPSRVLFLPGDAASGSMALAKKRATAHRPVSGVQTRAGPPPVKPIPLRVAGKMAIGCRSSGVAERTA